ncbi:unnamed protein product [Bemisia tabaci]|uniref:Ionotropic receptor n=1 Tax=Bemisia tabaci TaxID=7038 RepID=A0A9P0AJG9_BEMTA|nr:unnamed protein product [Bemisia tabaci]
MITDDTNLSACLEPGSGNMFTHAKVEKTCDERIFISSEELSGSSELSDLNFNLTRGLYNNPIWNSNNFLIFMLSQFNRKAYNSGTCDDSGTCNGSGTCNDSAIYNSATCNASAICNSTTCNSLTFNSATCVHQPEQNCKAEAGSGTPPKDYDALIFSFKFMWRFFRGLRTVICHPEGCNRYNPFTEDILWYNGEESEAYFDFSVTNMHGKQLKVIMNDFEGTIVEAMFPTSILLGLRIGILEELGTSLNFTLLYRTEGNYDGSGLHSHELGLKLDIDLHCVELEAIVERIDPSRYDFTVGVETEVMCLLTPHSKLMPQCLVAFKVFTPRVWICVILTITVFVSMQYVFLSAQSRTFRSLYSTLEVSKYANTSSIYTMYAYFICGSPPRLLLGKLFTGKILFSVFVFSAMIISNVFLGGMTTLLTRTVQYPEIDTVKDLEDSDIFIQVSEVESAVNYFSQLGLSEKMRAKLSSSLRHLFSALEPETSVQIFMENRTRSRFEGFVKNLHAILENDALLIGFPRSLITQNRMISKFEPYLPDEFYYHLVAERLKTFPCVFTFLKNSFLFHAFNRKTVQFLETGIASKILSLNEEFSIVPQIAPPSLESTEPRPYSLNDLQLPFFSLVFLRFFGLK